MTYTFRPSGVCSRSISLDISDDHTINSVSFLGGCSGNTQGICSLVKGMKAEDVVNRLRGIDCNGRGTSCPDQLANAIEGALAKLG